MEKGDFETWLTSADHCRRTLGGGQKAGNTFLRLKSDPKAEGRHKQRGETPLVLECRKALRNLPGSSDLSRP